MKNRKKGISLLECLAAAGLVAGVCAICAPLVASAKSADAGRMLTRHRASGANDLYLADYDGGEELFKAITPTRHNAGPHMMGGGIVYHGGPLLTAGPTAYFIWYGSWTASSKSIVTNFITNEGGTPYFNINSTYYNGSGQHVTNHVVLGGSTTDNYSQGTSLSDGQIQTIVATAIASGALGPKDTNGVYFVLTSADVNETSGFCTQYCGWHTHGTITGSDIKYAFVGNPNRCPSGCEAQTTSPNGDAGADGMVSIVAHELEEATTDPDLNAWFTRRGQENADICAWMFGTTSTAPNGSQYNVTMGGYNFLIQENYIATNGPCAISH